MTHDWQTTYAEAIEAFGGDTPGAALEQTIIDQFKEHPQAVTNAIRKIADAYTAGRIRSPWGALKTEIAKQIDADIHVPTGTNRKQAILRADQWMRNAGMHFDVWAEAEDELFGDRGPLREWRNDQRIQTRMLQAWNTVRPVGEAIELEAETRAAKWVADVKNAQEQARRPAAQETPA